ncbi:arginine--tRNA ligase, partial [Paenibacillus sepulcri]|nr:arginine--tRNA ligase [Paenibacillus sepulcri]
LAGRREIAEAVGIGAIIFGDLKHGRQLEVNFSLDEALRFEGETGPYLQYTAARAYKLLDKGGLTIDEAMQAVRDGALQKEGSFLSLPAAWTCLKTLTAYPVAIRETVKANEPSILARYLLDA